MLGDQGERGFDYEAARDSPGTMGHRAGCRGLEHVTASAVVRHAMEQLMATASPAEMVKLLGRPKGQNQQNRGRPRR